MHEKIRNSYNLLIREATDNVLKETIIKYYQNISREDTT